MLTDGKLHFDDTSFLVLLAGNKKTKKDRLWTYVRDARSAGSAQTPRLVRLLKDIYPQTHLDNVSVPLRLQADVYAEFNELYRSSGMACWVHARTPLALTEEALKRIVQLYVIET